MAAAATNREASDDPGRSLIEKWIRFKLDAIGALGEVKGKKVAKKAALTIIKKRLNPAESIAFMQALRRYLQIPSTPEVLFNPKPTRPTSPAGEKTQKVLNPGKSGTAGGGAWSKSSYAGGQQRALTARKGSGVKKKATTVVSGDLGINEMPGTPYLISEIVPTADIILGADPTDISVSRTAPGQVHYPYVPVDNPAAADYLMKQNYPGGRGVPDPDPRNSVDSLYPYMPTDSPLNKDFVRMDNLGTLLPPRPVMKPWRTARQKLFQPGDMVIHKKNHAVGLIRAIKGEEVMVSYGGGRYARVPMQELAIYYGTIRKLKRADPPKKMDYGRVVGTGKVWGQPNVKKNVKRF